MSRPSGRLPKWLRPTLSALWLTVLVGALARSWLRKASAASTSTQATTSSERHEANHLEARRISEGQYDIRQGVAAYAPIVGLFGSLSVPAIVVVFTVPLASDAAQHGTWIALATGLLVIGMVGSLLGAIGFAAIGAERDPTANLAAATMFTAIPTVLSIVAILGAFEVLAALYVPQATMMFTLITSAGGVFGVLFNAYSASDSLGLGPMNPVEHEQWVKSQWLKDRASAYKWGDRIALITSSPVAIGAILTVVGLRIPLTAVGVNVIVGTGVVLSLAGAFLGVRRTAHALDGPQVGLRLREAFGSNLAISIYATALVLCLP